MKLPTKISGIKFIGLITIIILVVSTLGCTSLGLNTNNSSTNNSSSNSTTQVAPSTPNYKTIEINPKNTSTWSDKGYALYKMGKYKEAIRAYDKAIEAGMQDMLKGKWMSLV